MAITLKELAFRDLTFAEEKKKVWTFKNDVGMIHATYTKDNKKFMLSLKLKSGFRTDGASVPSVFTWFLPKWDAKDMKYNCAPIIHDCLYAAKGIKGTFTREECDDFFRGAIRIAGYSRFKAGVADKCIEWFAANPTHWGDDDLKNVKNSLFSFSIKKLT